MNKNNIEANYDYFETNYIDRIFFFLFLDLQYLNKYELFTKYNAKT